MQRILLLLIVSHISCWLWGQPAVKVLPGATVRLQHQAQFVIKDANLKIDGAMQIGKGEGTVIFTGINDTIQGMGSLTFDSLKLRMPEYGLLTLDRNIRIASGLYFGGGLLNLGASIIDLDSTGVLVGESEMSRAFSNDTGYLQARMLLNAPSNVNPGNLGFVITSGANLGYTVIKRGHQALPGISLGSSIQRYFDITPTNNKSINATLRIQYFNAEMGGIAESSLTMWRSANASWTVLGSNTVDTLTNFVEKDHVQTMTRMTLAPGCPTITAAIPDVRLVQPGGAANTIYLGYGPNSTTLTATVAGGSGPYDYRWTDANGTIISSDPTLTISPTATTTYNLLVSDQFGCSAELINKTIAVVDVRCGNTLTGVTLCQKQANGTFKTVCVAPSKVADLLAAGSYLGACQPTPPLLVNQLRQPVPIEQMEATLSVQAMPNPSTNHFTLITKSPSQQRINIIITDNLGRVMESRQNLPATGTMQLGNNYRPGIYNVEVQQGKQRIVVRLLKLGN